MCMETNSIRPEQATADRGRAFLSVHSPTKTDFPEYEQQIRQRLQTGERIWGVQNVDDDRRAYNLYEGIKGVIAVIMYDNNAEEYTLYVDSTDDDALLSQKLEELTSQNSDPYFALGNAITIAESYAERLSYQ